MLQSLVVFTMVTIYDLVDLDWLVLNISLIAQTYMSCSY